MRSSKNRSRSKQNRPRTLGNIINRVFDSSGPEGKVRGTPAQIIEKYQLLARDAQLSNDRVAAENFLQHAEHYTRLLAEAMREMAAEQEARQQQGGNGGFNGGNGGGQRDRDWRERDQAEGDEQPYVGPMEVIGDEAGLVEDANPRREDRRDDQGTPRGRDGHQGRDRGNLNRDGQNRDGQNRDGQGRDGQNRDFNRNRDNGQNQNRGSRDQQRPPREDRREDRRPDPRDERKAEPREELRFEPPAFLTDPLPVIAEAPVVIQEVPIAAAAPEAEKVAKPRAPRKKPVSKTDAAAETAE